MIPYNLITPGPSGLAGVAQPSGGGAASANKKASLLADGFGAAQFQQFLNTALQWDQPQPAQASKSTEDRQAPEREVKESSRPERSKPDKSDGSAPKEQVEAMQLVEAPLLIPGEEAAQTQQMVNPFAETQATAQPVTQESLQDPALRNDQWQMAAVVAQWSVTTQNQTVMVQDQFKPMTTGVVQNSVSDLALAVYLKKGTMDDMGMQLPVEAAVESGERVEVSLNDLTALVTGRSITSSMEEVAAQVAKPAFTGQPPPGQPMMMAGAPPPSGPPGTLTAQAVKAADSTMTPDSLAGPGGSSAASGAKGAQSPTPTLSARSAHFAEQLAEQVGKLKVYSRPGQSEQVRLTLEPRELGALNMRLKVDADNKVHLIISTETEAAKEVLLKQIGQLKEALAKGDMGLGEVTIHVGGEEERNASSGQWARGDQSDEQSSGGQGSGDSEAKESAAPVTPPPSAGWVGDDGVSLVA